MRISGIVIHNDDVIAYPLTESKISRNDAQVLLIFHVNSDEGPSLETSISSSLKHGAIA